MYLQPPHLILSYKLRHRDPSCTINLTLSFYYIYSLFNDNFRLNGSDFPQEFDFSHFLIFLEAVVLDNQIVPIVNSAAERRFLLRF